MQVGLRRSLALLVLLLAAACSDSPVEPNPSASMAGPAEIAVWAPGDPGACDPYLDVNWCKESGICETSGGVSPDDSLSIHSCPGGGMGGGGTPPPAPPPPDTCKTANPVLDDPAVQAGFRDIWQRSRINEAQALRLETAAWIIRNSDGTHRLVELDYTQRGPCAVNGNWYAPPGAVAFVHTHPFVAGERMEICGAMKIELPGGQWVDMTGPDGRPVYQRYNNEPSFPDRNLITNVINRIRKAEGKEQLDGYVIDNERITRYAWNDLKDTPYVRCGY